MRPPHNFHLNSSYWIFPNSSLFMQGTNLLNYYCVKFGFIWFIICLSLFVLFHVNLCLLMFICIWIWYFVLYWVGDSPGWFAFASFCVSTFDFAHVTLYQASFTLANHMLEPCHALPLSLREAWLGWRQAYFRQGTATIVCRRVRRTPAYLFVSFVSYWHKVSVMCPTGTRVLGCNSTTYLLTYRCKRLFAIVIVSPAKRRAVRHHQVQEALTPTYLGCVPQRHNWVLTPTYFIVFNDDKVHCIRAYN